MRSRFFLIICFLGLLAVQCQENSLSITSLSNSITTLSSSKLRNLSRSRSRSSSSRANRTSRTNSTSGPSDKPKSPLPPGFENPLETGGEMLSRGHPDDKLGEPLNIIVSSLSSDDVLTAEGFLLWVTALGFGVSCLGQGDDDSFQYANLGKGNENVKQGSLSGNNGVLRWNYGLPSVGTCRETIEGGNHMRWFMQRTKNGTAIFLASSYEKGLDQHHTIEPNGYNRGRDDIVGIATRPEGVEWNGFKYNASAEWIPAGRLLNATSEGINHPDVAPPNGTAIDGRVALLKVNTLQKNNDEKRSSSSGMSIQPQLCVAALLLLMTTAVFLGM